jgi:glycosyltransferase involved in cell wall biosynthesis
MITVFTPTFNRSHLLPRLYKSLLDQTSKNFEWVIVDDGSLDHTGHLVASYIKEGKISINYFYQENKGKHIAINEGLDLAKGEYFFIVDSDDILVNNAIKKITHWFKELNSEFAGIVPRKCTNNYKRIGSKFPSYKFISDHVDKTYIKNIKGDLAEVYKTKIMRMSNFPVYEGENYCAEGLMWNRIAKKYKSVFIDECIYLAEYQDDGLSSNSQKLRHNSPSYAQLFYSELLSFENLSFWIRIRTLINLWRFSFNKKKLILFNIKQLNTLSILIMPIGFFIFLKDRLLLRSNK